MRIAMPSPASRMHGPAVAAMSSHLDVSTLDASSRRLSYRTDDGDVVLMCRGSDVPALVGQGLADLGVTGYDVAVEWILSSATPLTMSSFGAIRTSYVSYATRRGRTVTRIYTEYPRITAAWLSSRSGSRNVHLVRVSGSSEGLVAADEDSAGVLLVTSGQTLAANDLDHSIPLLSTDVCLVQRHPEERDLGALRVTDLTRLAMPAFTGSPP